MEIKLIHLFIYLLLGIFGSILFLKDMYKTFGELTLKDIMVALMLILAGPITLLCTLLEYLDRFKILKKNNK